MTRPFTLRIELDGKTWIATPTLCGATYVYPQKRGAPPIVIQPRPNQRPDSVEVPVREEVP